MLPVLSAISHPAGKDLFVNTHHDFSSTCVGGEELDFFKLYNQGERRQAQYMRETCSVKILSSIIPQVTLADPSHLPPTDWS